jgi:fermentation-respiration switch protein FrsA (DUF1100 family)
VGPGGGNHSREMPRGNRKQWIRRIVVLAAALFIAGLCFAWFVGSALTASAQRAIVLGNWARVFSPLLTWQIKLRIGVSSDWFSPERHIASVVCPKLIVGGASDLHTTLADTQALFAAAAEPKELWIINNAAHEDIYARQGADYERRILSFLDKSLLGKN